MNIFLIACGGAVGAVLRFLSSEMILKISRFSNFPFNTLFVNFVGSLFAGILYFFIIKNFENFDPKIKSFFLIGILGGFTTFSAFCLDVFRLFNASQYFLALSYIFSSVILSILATFFGFYLMKLFF